LQPFSRVQDFDDDMFIVLFRNVIQHTNQKLNTAQLGRDNSDLHQWSMFNYKIGGLSNCDNQVDHSSAKKKLLALTRIVTASLVLDAL